MALRVQHEPAFVLHSYAYTESSLILEAFTRLHGRVALIAKGVKKPSSNFRPVLLPLQPLALGWTGDAEVRTLKGAEWLGGGVMPTGDKLWAGLYANELLLKLLARDDAHPRLFDVYTACMRVLTERDTEVAELGLRAFELALLRDIGLLPKLEQENEQIRGQLSDMGLRITPELGLQPFFEGDEGAGISAGQWQAIEAALSDCMTAGNAAARAQAFTPLMRACEPVAAALKRQLRALLHYHCATPMLKTRAVLLEMQNL
jgi:DNA repair protein RecO (recombination protein O)